MKSGKFHLWAVRCRTLPLLASAGLLLAIAGCSTAKSTFGSAASEARGASDLIGNGQTFAIYGLEGRWAGPVTPTAANCGDATTGSMTIGDNGFGFAPFEGTTVITGTVSKDGTLSGTLSRTVGGGSGSGPIDIGLPEAAGKQQGGHPAAASHGPRTLSISLDAKAARGADGKTAIDGVLTSGRCTWNVALKRA